MSFGFAARGRFGLAQPGGGASDSGPGIGPTQALTVDTQLTSDDSGKTLTNRGAPGLVSATLPVSPTTQDRFSFNRTENQNFRVVPSPGQSFLNASGSTTTAGKYKQLGSNGAFMEVQWDGTAWLLRYERGTISLES